MEVEKRKEDLFHAGEANSAGNRGREIDRRSFGKAALAGLAGMTGLAAAAGGANSQKPPPGLQRKKEGDLYYRPLGATGLWVSELSLGGSPSPPERIFLAAVERGVNYCDTSVRYSRGNGERDIGRYLKGRRDKVHISTKFTPNRGGVSTADDAIKQVDGSLSRLGTDHVDILCIHGARTEKDVFSDWVVEAIERLRKAGKARFFGASVHNTKFDFLRRMIEGGHYQVLLLPTNAYFDPRMTNGPDTFSKILQLAAEKGVGIVAMKSLAAGGAAKVQAPPGISPAQAKLRWVLKRPEVSTILNEMVTFDYLKENLQASAADLSPREEAYLRRCVRETSHAYCRMCGTCEGNCPAALPIPELFRARMYAVDYGNRRRGANLANRLGATTLLNRCRRCGRCESSCPWGVRTGRLFEDLRHIAT